MFTDQNEVAGRCPPHHCRGRFQVGEDRFDEGLVRINRSNNEKFILEEDQTMIFLFH